MGTTVNDTEHDQTKNVCVCGHLEYAHGDIENDRPCYGFTADGSCDCTEYRKMLTHRSEIPQPLAAVPDPEDGVKADEPRPSMKDGAFTVTFEDAPPELVTALGLPDPRACTCGHFPSDHVGDDEHCAVTDCPCGSYRPQGVPCGICGHPERAHRGVCESAIVADGMGIGRCACLAYVHPSTECEGCGHRLAVHDRGRHCEVGNEEVGCGCDRFTATLTVDGSGFNGGGGGIFRTLRNVSAERPAPITSRLPDPNAIARYASALMAALGNQGIRHDVALTLTAAVLAGIGRPS